MIEQVPLSAIPAASAGALVLDYLAGKRTALDFYTHGPLDFSPAFQARCSAEYPRAALATTLLDYNRALGAHPNALANAVALRDADTFCVVAGQQAAFLGGYAAITYKIITLIRLALHLQERFHKRVLPLFWLATEDHDFGEINHADYPRADGEIGRVSFGGAQSGRPISDLAVGPQIWRAFDAYFEAMPATPEREPLKERCAPRADENYCSWHARLWSQLFSVHGLLLVEPRHLRPLAGDFFDFALRNSGDIRRLLDETAVRLSAAGYTSALTSAQTGTLYTFDAAGQRVRVNADPVHLDAARAQPERYSTDVALRPLLADRILPVLANVLGPGELAYQGMLKPLYAHFGIAQPLLFPRKRYTLLSRQTAERLSAYKTSARALLTAPEVDFSALVRALLPPSDLETFAEARRDMEAAFVPLRRHVTDLDPGLVKTWQQTLRGSLRNLEKLEERAVRARLSQMGVSKGELRLLCNRLLPRAVLQERVFSLPYLLLKFGPQLIETLFFAGKLTDFSHHILTVEVEAND